MSEPTEQQALELDILVNKFGDDINKLFGGNTGFFINVLSFTGKPINEYYSNVAPSDVNRLLEKAISNCKNRETEYLKKFNN